MTALIAGGSSLQAGKPRIAGRFPVAVVGVQVTDARIEMETLVSAVLSPTVTWSGSSPSSRLITR
jgi:hypothetical protein